jgi:putative transposase
VSSVVADAFDNAAAESCWARIQTELLDTRKWTSGVELFAAVHGWVEAFYNRRRHSALNMLVTSTNVGCRPPR